MIQAQELQIPHTVVRWFHTLVGIPFTTNVYNALAVIANADRMKHTAIAIHALKKKKIILEIQPLNTSQASQEYVVLPL